MDTIKYSHPDHSLWYCIEMSDHIDGGVVDPVWPRYKCVYEDSAAAYVLDGVTRRVS